MAGKPLKLEITGNDLDFIDFQQKYWEGNEEHRDSEGCFLDRSWEIQDKHKEQRLKREYGQKIVIDDYIFKTLEAMNDKWDYDEEEGHELKLFIDQMYCVFSPDYLTLKVKHEKFEEVQKERNAWMATELLKTLFTVSHSQITHGVHYMDSRIS